VSARSVVNTFSDGAARLRVVATNIGTVLMPAVIPTGARTSGPGRLAQPAKATARTMTNAACKWQRSLTARLRNVATMKCMLPSAAAIPARLAFASGYEASG
jgi:hypothetical protein